MSSRKKISKEDAVKIVKECYTVADFCRKVGWEARGGNYRVFYNYVKEYGLDTSHFTGCKSNLNNKLNGESKKSLKEYSNGNILVKGPRLLKKLLEENLKERKCECCGRTEWNGQLIPLEVHHVDGNCLNNDIENLQLLCPNCHATTENYRGRKNKKEPKKYYCKNCGKEISSTSRSGLCVKCCSQTKRRIEMPNKEDFLKIFENVKSFTGVATYYNCSDNNVRKWAIKYGLPTHSKDMKEYLKRRNKDDKD